MNRHDWSHTKSLPEAFVKSIDNRSVKYTWHIHFAESHQREGGIPSSNRDL